MLYNEVVSTSLFFYGEAQMHKSTVDYNFTDHKFPDIKLERCSLINYNPSHTEQITISKGIQFIIVTEGKGYMITPDKRQTLTRGNGIMLLPSNTVEIKSDSIEPFSLIYIKLFGESVKQLTSLIEKREEGCLLDFSGNGKIIDAAQDLITECGKTFNTDFSIMLCLMEFLLGIEERYTVKKQPTKNVYMTQAVDYIKKNYNKNITVESISDLLGIERSYLSRLFKTYKNKSTQNYIIDYRISQAKRMFEEEDMNVSQVSAAVGYTNIYCFSRIFKSRVGIPPKEYMERCKKP